MFRSHVISFGTVLFPRRRCRSVSIVLGALVSGIALAISLDFPLLSAADAPKGNILSTDTDNLVALNVRKALETNPETAGLNFSISVTAGRETIIGGPISDGDLLPKIEAIVKKVRGVGEVKVECWVPTTEDPLRRLVGERMSKPESSQPALPLPAPLNAAPPTVFAPPVTQQPTPVDVGGPGTVTVQRASSMNGPFLLDPVGPGGTRVGTQQSTPGDQGNRVIHGYPTIPPVSVPMSPSGRLTGQGSSGIAALRDSDARFIGITVEMKGGTAIIGGKVVKYSDVWDFSEGLRKLPGIDRVVIGSVDVR